MHPDDQSFATFLAWERSSRDVLDVKRIYIDMAGDVMPGILLSELVYWHLPNKSGQTKLRIERDGYLWIAVQRNEWWERIRFTPNQADYAIRKLAERGLIVRALYKFSGVPTVHLRLDLDIFLQRFHDELRRSAQGSDRLGDHSPETSEIHFGNFRNPFQNNPKSISEICPSPLTTTTNSETPTPPAQAESLSGSVEQLYLLVRTGQIAMPRTDRFSDACKILSRYLERAGSLDAAVAQLRPFAAEADARQISPTNLCWLTEWAAAGQIPPQRKKQNRAGSKPMHPPLSPETEAQRDQIKQTVSHTLRERLARRKE